MYVCLGYTNVQSMCSIHYELCTHCYSRIKPFVATLRTHTQLFVCMWIYTYTHIHIHVWIPVYVCKLPNVENQLSLSFCLFPNDFGWVGGSLVFVVWAQDERQATGRMWKIHYITHISHIRHVCTYSYISNMQAYRMHGHCKSARQPLIIGRSCTRACMPLCVCVSLLASIWCARVRVCLYLYWASAK